MSLFFLFTSKTLKAKSANIFLQIILVFFLFSCWIFANSLFILIWAFGLPRGRPHGKTFLNFMHKFYIPAFEGRRLPKTESSSFDKKN